MPPFDHGFGFVGVYFLYTGGEVEFTDFGYTFPVMAAEDGNAVYLFEFIEGFLEYWIDSSHCVVVFGCIFFLLVPFQLFYFSL